MQASSDTTLFFQLAQGMQPDLILPFECTSVIAIQGLVVQSIKLIPNSLSLPYVRFLGYLIDRGVWKLISRNF